MCIRDRDNYYCIKELLLYLGCYVLLPFFVVFTPGRNRKVKSVGKSKQLVDLVVHKLFLSTDGLTSWCTFQLDTFPRDIINILLTLVFLVCTVCNSTLFSPPQFTALPQALHPGHKLKWESLVGDLQYNS